MDAHGATRETATTITPGETLTGFISSGGDIDGFRFEAEAGTRLRLKMSFDAPASAAVPTVTAGYFSGDEVLDQAGFFGPAPLVIEGIVQASGTQFLQLSPGRFPLFGDPVQYSVSLEVLSADLPDDHSDAREGASRLATGSTIRGSIDHAGDLDVFAVDRGIARALQLMAEKTGGIDGLSVTVIEQRDLFGLVPISAPLVSHTTVANAFDKSLLGLAMSNQVYVQVSGPVGAYELSLAALERDATHHLDAIGTDKLTGTRGAADTFFMQRDLREDQIRNFEPGRDRIDVSQFGAEVLSDLEITNAQRSDGSIRWIRIGLPGDEIAEIRLRTADPAQMDADALGAGDFIFLPPSVRTAGIRVEDGVGAQALRGTDAAEIFVFGSDGQRDLLRGFELGRDLIDVSAFAASVEDLRIDEQLRKDGSVNWITIADLSGEVELALRLAGSDQRADALSFENFVFSETPIAREQVIRDGARFDRLDATDQVDIFVLSNDGLRDLIRGFDATEDKIDVSAFAHDLDDLTITQQRRKDGFVNWLNIADLDGETEVSVRLAPGQDMALSALGSDRFIFSDMPIERPKSENRILDGVSRDDLRATSGKDIFVMRDDSAVDLIRGFEPGVDKIDLSDFVPGAAVTFTDQLRTDGSVRWVEVFVDPDIASDTPPESPDFLIRFAKGYELSQTALDADDFLF